MTSKEMGEQIIFLQEQMNDFPDNQEIKKAYTAAVNAWKDAYTSEINSKYEIEKAKVAANSEMMKGFYAYHKSCIDNRLAATLSQPQLYPIYPQQLGLGQQPPSFMPNYSHYQGEQRGSNSF
ncbi:hypothetical protein ACGK9R_10895 [Halomonas sp. HNIBRBA4712]|uniref:hypothetical protein n=1 Tax=Halomonas sp. HNIBRBA4712 TaxID=3373087 RepID=UPI0037477868